MSSAFLESNNITSLINTVRTNVNQEINFDITSEPKYINVLKKLVKTIHKANIDKPVSTEYMNDLVVNKCVPFLVNQVKKNRNNSNSKKSNNVFGNLPLQTSDRPMATRLNDTGISKQNGIPGMDASSDFSGLTLAGELPLNNPYSNNQNQGFDLPPRQMPNLTNMPEQTKMNLEPPRREMPRMPQNQNQNQNMSLELPPREMPRMPQGNMQMDIANLPTPNNFDQNPVPSPNNNLADNNLAGVNSKSVDENIDFAKRLEQMQKEREYDNGAADQIDEFNKQNTQINMAGQEALQQRESVQTENKNEFFRKLADKNVEETPESRARNAELYDMNNSNLQKNYMDDGGLDIDESMYTAYDSNIIQLGDRNASQADNQIKNLENNIRDSTRLVNGGENAGISEMIKSREQEVSKDNSKEYIDNTFLSTNFQYERRKRKIVCLDISDNLLDLANGSDSDGDALTKSSIVNISNTFWGRFRVHLAETLVIDKLSDVFIESIIVNNPAQANRFSNLYMVIDIEEFNIKTATNNARMMDKFVLPNENTDSAGSTKIMKYHLKSNYVATVNPTTLSSLTFNITNEDGDSVQSQFTDSARNNVNSLNVGTNTFIEVDNTAANIFNVLDAVYNSSQQFVGNVATSNDANGGDRDLTDINTLNRITLTRPTNVHLYSGESLFFPSSRTTLTVNEGANNGMLVGDTTLTVAGGDATTIFNLGDSVYLGTGVIIGKIARIGATSIVFEQGVTQFIPNGASLYNANPLPRVFASNEKSNRIILELVIMSR